MRDVDTFDRALRAGGDDFVTKSIESAELVTRVKSAGKLRGGTMSTNRRARREHQKLPTAAAPAEAGPKEVGPRWIVVSPARRVGTGTRPGTKRLVSMSAAPSP